MPARVAVISVASEPPRTAPIPRAAMYFRRLGGIEILRFENGEIAESWEAINYLSLFVALGFELKPREVKK